MKFSYKDGFSAVEAVVIVLVVGIIAALGYVLWNNMQKEDSKTANNESSQVEPAAESDEPTAEDVKPIENEEDLDNIEGQLDDTSVEDDDSKQAESQASF